MNLVEFLDELRVEAARHCWEVWHSGCIRTVGGACPVSVLVNNNARNWFPDAKKLGLDPDLVERVVHALTTTRSVTKLSVVFFSMQWT